MKAMIWKELRENFKWALLALLVLTIAEFYALSSSRSDTENLYNELTLCSSAFLEVTSFGCSAVGVALGVVQILPELRRDQWAALLHRPVPRSVIFFGKIVAGLTLYFMATVPPLFLSVAYVATPGQFAAPFVPGMIKPGFSDLFLGLVFYCAAILLCLHRGRWFGSRGLIVLSLPILFMMLGSADLPFLFTIPCAMVFLGAAWGAMMSSEVVKNRTWVGRVTFVLVALIGALSAWLLLILVLPFLTSKSTLPIGTFRSFMVTQDGQVFTSTAVDDNARVLTDASGKVVTDPKYVGNNSYGSFLQMLPFASIMPLEVRESYLKADPRSLRNFVEPIQNGYGNKESWFLLVAQRYFVGYDSLSRRCVGICDEEGFKPVGALPKPFPLKMESSDYWSGVPSHYWSGPQLYAIDFSERSMTPVFNAQQDTIYGAENLIDAAKREKPAGFSVALKNEVRIFDPQAKLISIIPYSHDPAVWSEIWVANNKTLGRLYLQYTASYLRHVMPIYLDEIDNQGNILHEYTQPAANSPAQPPGWMDQLSVVTLSFLPAFAVASYLEVTALPQENGTETAANISFPEKALRFGSVYLAIIFVLALVFAFLTFLWARQVGFAPRSAGLWALFVFCFGLPGLLTFRCVSDWPTRVRCPACGQKREIEKETCMSCHQAWPVPEANKTEILDSEAVGRA